MSPGSVSYAGTSNVAQSNSAEIKISFDFPDPPTLYGPCRVLISEVAPKKHEFPTFVELRRSCPIAHRSEKTSLAHYHLLLVRASDRPKLLTSYSFKKQTLQNPKSKRSRSTDVFFVLGHKSTTPDVDFETIVNMVSENGAKQIPNKEGETFAVVLLYFYGLT